MSAATPTVHDQITDALQARGSATYWQVLKGYLDPDEVAGVLLPLVERLRAETAAAALRDAADAYEDEAEMPHIVRLAETVYRPGDNLSSIWLRDRADALTTHSNEEQK